MHLTDLLTESLYMDELTTAITDIIVHHKANSDNDISFAKMIDVLAELGFDITDDVLSEILEQHPAVMSVNDDTVVVSDGGKTKEDFQSSEYNKDRVEQMAKRQVAKEK